MRRVIKNQKKMKDTMYIVFGVFALALFGITMLNPSYAEEWLIIDDALDAVAQQITSGSWGFEKVEEEKMILPVEEDEGEDEDVVEPEATPVEEIEEWEGEDSQDLDDTNLEWDDGDKVNEKEGDWDEGNQPEAQTSEVEIDEESHGVDNKPTEETESQIIDNEEKLEKIDGEETWFFNKMDNEFEVMNTSETFTVSFDVDWWTPRDSITVTWWSKLVQNVKKYSSTSNIWHDGSRIWNYANSLSNYESINIPWASRLHVTLTYGTQPNYDYVYVFSGRWYGTVSNNISSDQLLYKYNGWSNNLTTVDFYVDSDTVTFAFYSNASQGFYGYYAVVEPVTDMPSNPTKEGLAFDGWYKDNGDKWSFTSDIVDKNITLYAHWREPEAILMWWYDFSLTLKSIAAWNGIKSYNTQDNYIKKFIRANSLTNSYNKRLVSDPSSDIPVYAWFDSSDWTIYYYSAADKIYFNTSVYMMFWYMKSLKIVDLKWLDPSKITTASSMFWSSAIKTIYATFEISSDQIGYYNSSVFEQAGWVVWWNGTKYSTYNDNASFARPDTKTQEWYFTDPSAITVKFKIAWNDYEEMVVSKWEIISKPTNPQLPWYKFDGWYIDEDFTEKFDFSKRIENYIEIFGRIDWNDATLLSWESFNKVVKNLSNKITNASYSTVDNLIQKIKRAETIPQWVTTWLISTSYSSFPVYAWFDSVDSTIYYYSEADTIYVNPTASMMFYNLKSLQYIDLAGLDMSRVKTMYDTFWYCTSLTWIDFSNLDLHSLTYMNYMFQGCSALTWVNFSNADMSSVTSMDSIFQWCDNLEDADFSDINLSSLKSMTQVFKYHDKLKKVNLSNANLSSATTIDYLVGYCSSLKEIDLSNVNLSSLKEMKYTFNGANSLKKIDFSNANLESLEKIGDYSFFPSSIQEVNFEWTDLRSLTTMYALFQTKYNLKNVNFSGTRLDSVQDMSWMFASSNMTWVDFSNAINLNSVTNMNYMFQSSYALQKVDFWNAYLGNVTTMDSMFNYCTSLGEVHFGNLDFHSLKNTSAMFRRTIFTWFDFEGADFSSLENTNYMFESCDNLESLNFSGAKFGKKISYAFEYCKNLKEINFYWADFSTVEDMSNMFYETRGLKNINFDNIKTNSNLTNMYGMFRYSGLTGIDLSNFDTSNVTNMSDMFYNCTGLDVLDLSNFDTSNVTGMNNMFGYANNLSTIYVSDKFTLDKVTSSGYMFAWTTNLVGWNGTTFNPEKIDWEYARIDTLTISWYFTNILDKLYTITYNINGWVLSWEKTTYTQRDSFTLPVPIRTWYTFLWWTWSNGLEPEILVNIAEFTIWDLEYTANWELGKYKIIFHTDGWNEINPIEKDYNSVINITLPTPTKECNEFSWWDIELPEIMPAHNITLKAIWNYTCSRSSWGWWAKKSETTTREIAIDTNTENEHNSANEKENEIEISEEDKTTLNDETSNQVISVTQEVSENGTVEAIVETVKIKNTDIVATVRTEVSSASSSSSSSSSTIHTKEQNDAYNFAQLHYQSKMQKWIQNLQEYKWQRCYQTLQ